MPFDTPAPVIRHDALGRGHFLLTLECPGIAREARAGQFVMLRTREGLDPLLRRPMSIFRVLPGRRGRIQILYKIVGQGTRCLSERSAGQTVPTLGPLGNGFRLPPPGTRAVLVSGGIGIAIFPFLVESLRAARREKPLLVYGARAKHDLVGLDFFRERRVPMRLATEDGSLGTKGFVTHLLEPLLAGRDGAARMEIFACGPTPMLRAVGALALRAGVPSQLALESQMPCGIGVCLGCVVRCPGDASGPIFRRVCTEGPVFGADEVLL
jgi:dihydroorotate dehydrogenase electron transfer subunit